MTVIHLHSTSSLLAGDFVQLARCQKRTGQAGFFTNTNTRDDITLGHHLCSFIVIHQSSRVRSTRCTRSNLPRDSQQWRRAPSGNLRQEGVAIC